MSKKLDYSHSSLMIKEQEFWDYLFSDSLQSDFSIDPMGILRFHWASWDQTCKWQKEHIKTHYQDKLNNLEEKLESFKNIPAWVSHTHQTVKISLYDLYMGYSDKRMRDHFFNNKMQYLVSFETEAGPFVSIPSLKWFDKEIFALFIFHRILTEEIPLRRFRLFCEIPMEYCVGLSATQNSLIHLVQFDENGLLMRIYGRNMMSKILEQDIGQFKIDLSLLSCLGVNGMQDYSLSQTSPSLTISFQTETLRQRNGIFQHFTQTQMSSYYCYLRFEDLFSEDIELLHEFKQTLKKLIDEVQNNLKIQLDKKAA